MEIKATDSLDTAIAWLKAMISEDTDGSLHYRPEVRPRYTVCVFDRLDDLQANPEPQQTLTGLPVSPANLTPKVRDVLVDRALIEAGRRDSGAFTSAQAKLLGLPGIGGLQKGWQDRLIAERRMISREDADRFVALRSSGHVRTVRDGIPVAAAVIGKRDGADPKFNHIAYVDGGCWPNPGGPGGAGVVISIVGIGRLERSIHIPSPTTNNRAELMAVREALLMIKDRSSARISIGSDSQYTIGAIYRGWNAKANRDLVVEVRRLAAECQRFHMFHVKGHSGIDENECADRLAAVGAEHPEWSPALNGY